MGTSGGLHILFFIETGGPGGAERSVLLLAEALLQAGHKVRVATLRRGWLTDELERRYIPTHKLPAGRVGLLFALRRLVRKYKISVVHSHLLDSNFYTSVASRLFSIPAIGTEHGDVHHSSKKRFLRLKLRTISMLGMPLTAVSSFTASALQGLGVNSRLIHVVPNPVLPPSTFSADIRKEVRAELGVMDEFETHWLWIHVANFRPVKDQRTLISGFALSLKSSMKKQTLVLVGDGPERGELEELASELEIQANIRFVGFRNDTPRYLFAADGFVLSSLSEALPMSLLEAIAHGLFPVCTAVGGIPEVLTDPDMLTPSRSPEALAHAMNQVVNNPQAAKQRAAALQQRILKTYSTGQIAEAFIKLYEKVL